MRGATEASTHVFYEAPHRILDTLSDVVATFGETHPVALARELTKLHEEFLRGTAKEILTTLQARPVVRGEMVLLLRGELTEQENTATLTLAGEVAALMKQEKVSESDALKRVAKARGIGKSEAYREWQRNKR